MPAILPQLHVMIYLALYACPQLLANEHCPFGGAGSLDHAKRAAMKRAAPFPKKTPARQSSTLAAA
jgi:hypothetical protein